MVQNQRTEAEPYKHLTQERRESISLGARRGWEKPDRKPVPKGERVGASPVSGDLLEDLGKVGPPVYRILPAEEGYVIQVAQDLKQLNLRSASLEARRVIMAAIVKAQTPYVKGGVSLLKRLAMSDIAGLTGYSEATVCRTIKDTATILPDERVIPTAYFFKPNLAVKAALREVIDIDPGLTDKQLAKMLREKGFNPAPVRRTVNKYRNQLKIPPYPVRIRN